MGVDVALQRVQAYRVFDDKTVVTVSQLFPVADVEEFTVSPQRQQLQAAEERRRTTREKSTVQRLVTAGSIPDGTPLMLRAHHRDDAGGSHRHRGMGQPGPETRPRPLVQRSPPAAGLGVRRRALSAYRDRPADPG